MKNINSLYKKLNELGSVGRGKSKHRPRNAPILYSGNYPFIQTGDVKKANFYITEYSQTYNETGLAQSKLWKKGTLCITIAANIAETGILGIDACFPDSIIGFIPDPKKSDVRFVKYYLETYKLQMQSISQGATQDNLSLEKLLSINFLVPSLPEQQQIAEILSTYDDLIETNNQRIATLEQLAQQIYKEWFVRMRFPGWETTPFHHGIPEGWVVSELIEFGKVITGKTPSTSVPDYFGGDIPFIKTPDMHNNTFICQTEESLTTKGAESQVSQKIPSGAICTSCIGTSGVVSITTKQSMTNQQINSLVIKDETFREYLFFAIKLLKPTIELFGSTGATMTNLSKGKFERLKLFRPNYQLVQKFNSLSSPMLEEIKTLSEQNITLTKTRNLLLPRLISGKLTIKQAEALAH